MSADAGLVSRVQQLEAAARQRSPATPVCPDCRRPTSSEILFGRCDDCASDFLVAFFVALEEIGMTPESALNQYMQSSGLGRADAIASVATDAISGIRALDLMLLRVAVVLERCPRR